MNIGSRENSSASVESLSHSYSTKVPEDATRTLEMLDGRETNMRSLQAPVAFCIFPSLLHDSLNRKKPNNDFKAAGIGSFDASDISSHTMRPGIGTVASAGYRRMGSMV
jgi:hypothetical protein